jgi:hypothetical protein
MKPYSDKTDFFDYVSLAPRHPSLPALIIRGFLLIGLMRSAHDWQGGIRYPSQLVTSVLPDVLISYSGVEASTKAQEWCLHGFPARYIAKG